MKLIKYITPMRKKKTSHTDKDESKLISTLKSRQFISGGLI